MLFICTCTSICTSKVLWNNSLKVYNHMNHKQDLLKLSLTVANLLFIEQLYSLILIPSRSIKLNGYRRKNVTRFTTCLSNFTNVYILKIVNTIKFIKMQSKINKPTVTELHQVMPFISTTM